MLSRIANCLFWTGRYIERIENNTRFIQDQYYDFLDAPFLHKKNIVLASILNMQGSMANYYTKFEELSENEVLDFVILDRENLSSIFSNVVFARENTKATRTNISEEFWESINRFYLDMSQFAQKKIEQDALHKMTYKIVDHCSGIHGLIDKIFLMESPSWSFIKLGIHLERAAQISRMMIAKIDDVNQVKNEKLGEALERYHLKTLLDCTCSLHISRELYSVTTEFRNIVDLLVLKENFPKSISYNLNYVYNILDNLRLSLYDNEEYNIAFVAGKLKSQFLFTTADEIIDKGVRDYLNKTLSAIYNVSLLIEKKFFNY